MKPKRRRQVGKYLRRLADKLELRDWTVHLMHAEPHNPNHGAAMEATYGQRHVRVWIRSDLFDYSPEEQRQTLVHELVHVHTSAMVAMVRETLPGQMAPGAHEVFEREFTRQMEHAVDAMAEAVAHHLPLPPWCDD